MKKVISGVSSSHPRVLARKNDLKDLSNSKEFQSLIMEDSFKGIKEAISKKWKKVELFNIINLSVIIEIKSSSFSSALKKISKYFELMPHFCQIM